MDWQSLDCPRPAEIHHGLHGGSGGRKRHHFGAAFFKSQLAEVDLADLIKRDPLTLPQNATFAQIAQTFAQHRFQHIYIVDGQRELLGAVSLHDVKALLDRTELETLVIADDIMDENFPSISPLHSMGTLLRNSPKHDRSVCQLSTTRPYSG